jgi:hypothetical protein
MGRWKPCTRKEFIGKLKRLGFTPPEPGGRHFYMRFGTYTLTIPGNKEYTIVQLKMLLSEIEQGIRRKISLEEWDSL